MSAALPAITLAAPARAADQASAKPVETIQWRGKPIEARSGEWILGIGADSGVVKGRQAAAQVRALQQRLGAGGSAAVVEKQLGRDGQFLLDVPDSVGYEQVLAATQTLPGFKYLEPNAVLKIAATPSDPLYGYEYGLNNTGTVPFDTGTSQADADIDAPEAWDLTTGSSSVVVAVVDSGVDYTHPDLAANMWHNPFETAGDGIDNDGNGYVDDVYGIDAANNDADPMDDNNHGTHVAGTIGAAGNNGVGVAGVAWHVQIMALKFLAADGSGASADAIEALNYAAAMRQKGVNVRLTSNSWTGGGYEQAMRDAIAATNDAGMLFVCAAGNGGADKIGDNNDAVASYPGNYDVPNVVTVAATDRWDNLAAFSNYGPATVDLAAPGVDITSTYPANRYVRLSGTSMATPHVSGVAALAWSLKPDATVQEVRGAILGGVDPLPALSGKVATGGRLNALGALRRLAPDASIAGTVWEDADGDASRDAGEAGRGGVTVFLDSNGNGAPDPGEASTTSAADGAYAFNGLSSGAYRVAEQVPAGFRQTVPSPAAPAYDVTLAPSQHYSGADFGLYNPPPTVGSLAASPDPAAAGTDVTLTASDVGDVLSGVVARVEFFRESNGAAGLQAGTGGDTLLGSDATPAPYSLAVPTAGLAAGTFTYYARAVDDRGAAGAAVATTHTVTNTAPTLGPLAPASATDAAGVYRTFTASYRDANGAGDLVQAYLRVNDFVPNMLDCYYDAVNNKLYVRSEDGTKLVGGFAPGSANVIATTHGSLDCSQTSVARSGTQLTINWTLSCAQPLTGPNVLYLRARDRANVETGYQRASTWTVSGSQAPSAAAPAPLSPSAAPGAAQEFSVTYSDPDGWENLANVFFRANADLPWMLDAIYHVPSNRLYLRNDTTGALLGGFSPGSNNVISNGHGSLNCAAVSVTHSGTQLTVNWNLTAGAYLAGPNRLFVRARDAAGNDTGYVEHPGAVWTVSGNAAPTNVGVTPAAATDAAGSFRTLLATYNDPDGALNLNYAYLSVNSNDPARRLQAVYNVLNNRLYLLADDGVTLLGGFAPGSPNVLSNSHGSLNCAATTISRSDTRLTVGWNVSATAALAGTNSIWLRARDRGGLDTGFQQQPGVAWTIS